MRRGILISLADIAHEAKVHAGASALAAIGETFAAITGPRTTPASPPK